MNNDKQRYFSSLQGFLGRHATKRKFDFGQSAFGGSVTAADTNKKATRAEKCIDVLTTEEAELQNAITELQSIYAYLERQQAAVKSEHAAAMSAMEKQRASAKRQLENELKNQIRQVEYLNLVVGYRPN